MNFSERKQTDAVHIGLVHFLRGLNAVDRNRRFNATVQRNGSNIAEPNHGFNAIDQANQNGGW